MPLITRNTRANQPRNTSAVAVARSAIAGLRSAAVKQYDNAVSVDGFPIIYYRKLTSGVRCTCCGGADSMAPQVVPDSGVVKLDPEGHASPSFLQTMLQGSVFSINRYGTRPTAFDGQGGDIPQQSVPHSPLIQSLEVHNKSTTLDDPFAEQVDPSDPDEMFDIGAEIALDSSTAALACAVCLGTGYVGGYAPANRQRIVIDSQARWVGPIAVNRTRLPNVVEVVDRTDVTSVSCQVLLPAGGVSFDAIRLWDNKEQLTGFTVYAEIDGQQVPSGQWDDRVFTGAVQTLTIVFDPNLLTQFTHLELQVDLGSDPVHAEWSKLAYNENLAVAENMDTPSLVVSPRLPRVGLYDIITEAVYGKTWKITSCTPTIDSQRRVHGHEAQARLLQTYEIENLLPPLVNRTSYLAHRQANLPKLAAASEHKPVNGSDLNVP